MREVSPLCVALHVELRSLCNGAYAGRGAAAVSPPGSSLHKPAAAACTAGEGDPGWLEPEVTPQATSHGQNPMAACNSGLFGKGCRYTADLRHLQLQPTGGGPPVSAAHSTQAPHHPALTHHASHLAAIASCSMLSRMAHAAPRRARAALRPAWPSARRLNGLRPLKPTAARSSWQVE